MNCGKERNPSIRSMRGVLSLPIKQAQREFCLKPCPKADTCGSPIIERSEFYLSPASHLTLWATSAESYSNTGVELPYGRHPRSSSHSYHNGQPLHPAPKSRHTLRPGIQVGQLVVPPDGNPQITVSKHALSTEFRRYNAHANDTWNLTLTGLSITHTSTSPSINQPH